MSHYMILLAIIPLCCYELTKPFNYRYRNMLRGISIGMVISPVSFALLKFTFLPVIGQLLGLIGLAANLTHGSAGYACLISIGFLEIGAHVTPMGLVMINLINGLLFSSVYGMIGYVMDRNQEKKSFVRKVVFL